MEAKDLLELKALMGGNSMSAYEQFKTQHIQTKSRTSGVGIAGLAVGVGAAVLAVGGAAWAGSRAQNAKDVAVAKNDGLRDLLISSKNDTNATLDRIARSLERETDARVSGDLNITNTINDTVSGSQQGTQTQSVAQEVTQQVMTGLMTGKYSENPLKVVRVSGQRECGCDGGCNI